MRRRAIGATLACTSLALLAACGGDSGTTSPDGSNPNNSSGDTATVSATVVDSVANAFDAQVAAGDGLYTSISHILGGLIPTLVEGQESAVDTTIANGDPFVTEQQFSDLTAAFQNNVTFTVGNFVSAAASTGITTAAGAPIDSATFTQALAPLIGTSRYAMGDVLPATVIAIGQARAKRKRIVSPDPVWGDGLLDPLQATLLMYALDFSTGSGASASGTLASAHSHPSFDDVPAVPWGRAVKGAMTGLLSKIFHFPFGKVEAAKATICASVILYSYKFGLQQSERDLWHKDPAATNHPYQSQLTAYLVFDFKPYNQLSATVLDKIGCQLPTAGAAPGKTVSWHLDDTLTKHGSLTDQQTVTDNTGHASATYQTIAEVTPHVLQQGLANNATGTWQIAAHGLLPDKWSGLEKSVGLGRTPADSALRLFVNYYTPPSSIELKARVTINATPNGSPSSFSGTGDVDVPMALLSPNLALYEGEGPGTYENMTYTWPASDCAMVLDSYTNGTMVAELEPDSTTLGNVQAYVQLAGSSGPNEHYHDCTGSIDFPRLWYTWLNQDVQNLKNFTELEPYHLQRTLDETYSNAEANATEHVVLDLYLTP